MAVPPQVTPQELRGTHILQSNLHNTISEYQLKICQKFNNSCWKLSLDGNKFMLLCIIPPQIPPKVDICISNSPTREQNFRQMVSWGRSTPLASALLPLNCVLAKTIISISRKLRPFKKGCLTHYKFEQIF